ncbi:MAG: alanine racemase [Vulcanimicrobiaceae bacterium]
MIGRLEISLPALCHNAGTLAALAGGHSHAAFVVKANAYGHGAVETALAIESFGAKLCVYSFEEAIALRDGGITAPVVVLGPIPPYALEAAVAENIELALWDTKHFAHQLAAAARKRAERARVHVKVNTGLNRLGVEPNDLADTLEDYVRIADIEIAGIFSHLAAAEEIDSPYTMHQLEQFERACGQAQSVLAPRHLAPTLHIAASAAAMLWPQTRLDMARFGIALYGLWPSPQTREAMLGQGLALEPALAFRSSLVVTRTIATGSAVGYGNTFHAPREMRIGIVPLGYADGIPRALSNRGAFLVDGMRCPIVGRIAMNMTFLDISHAPQAHAETPVTLIGRDGPAEVTADDWAEWAQTINYEIVARLPSELTRIYISD